jgi:hypothetical protein
LLAVILRPISFLELAGAEIFLEENSGVNGDLVPKRDVCDELRNSMLRETIAL